MRFYRVHFTSSYDGSAGYEFFTSKREAAKAAHAWVDDPEKAVGYYDAEIEPIEIQPTRQGIRHALHVYASHPNNG